MYFQVSGVSKLARQDARQVENPGRGTRDENTLP